MHELARTMPKIFQSLSLAMIMTLPLIAPPQAFAQYGKAFRNSPKLTKSDITIVRKLVREDLTGKSKGTTLSWNNAASGNSGTVTLLADFRSQGRDCRRVGYVVKSAPRQAAASSSTYELTSCHLPDGTWKIDSAAKPD